MVVEGEEGGDGTEDGGEEEDGGGQGALGGGEPHRAEHGHRNRRERPGAPANAPSPVEE